MVPGEQAEDAIVADVANGKDAGEVRAMGVGDDDAEQQRHDGKFTMKSLLWHGGSVWDAWFSCASNQVRTLAAAGLPLRPTTLHAHAVLTGSPLAGVCSWRSCVRRWRRCC
jgi:hypothetical protein